MQIYLPLLVAIAGGFMYALSERPKPAEIGRLMFACGLLAYLVRYAYTVTPLR